jgi:hypothetical protein
MWVVSLGIWPLFVWEDVVDGSESGHDQGDGDGGAGGVEAVGPVDDEPHVPLSPSWRAVDGDMERPPRSHNNKIRTMTRRAYGFHSPEGAPVL